MKLIIREYLSSLREREELDAILPDLLSELGYTVYSRPARGTVQHGVDIAAISPSGEEPSKVYLFSVKRGDLTRAEWNNGTQALRPSLDEIRDAYIPTRIPAEYAGLNIVICLCFGGDMQEQVRAAVTGYISQNTTDRISFEEWNGDKIAGLLLGGVLREEVLPRPLRANFQKAVALLDEPDVAYRHFARLAAQLRAAAQNNDRARVRAARQLYLAVWVMYVWGRDLDNLEAPYQASELALLTVWELLKPAIGSDSATNTDLTSVLTQLIGVHFTIAAELLEKIAPFMGTRDALAVAVQSRTAVDVNLKLFDLLGRIGLVGGWLHWMNQRAPSESNNERQAQLDRWRGLALTMIENNPALWLPVADHETTDIALFLLFWLVSGAGDGQRVAVWLESMVDRLNFTMRTRSGYPSSSSDYRDLIHRTADRSDAYFEEHTAGSTLIPTLTAWAAAMGLTPSLETLSKLVAEKLGHCTMQLWSTATDSDANLYTNEHNHGRALCDLPITATGRELVAMVAEDCKTDQSWSDLSAVQAGFEPIVLLACRHWRVPLPPDIYIGPVKSAVERDLANEEQASGA
ncbi:MAG: hypothetical protein Q7U20_06955 [Caulobacter sp.]|nr:hypothetical protein [Caulobacter sp.]